MAAVTILLIFSLLLTFKLAPLNRRPVTVAAIVAELEPGNMRKCTLPLLSTAFDDLKPPAAIRRGHYRIDRLRCQGSYARKLVTA